MSRGELFGAEGGGPRRSLQLSRASKSFRLSTRSFRGMPGLAGLIEDEDDGGGGGGGRRGSGGGAAGGGSSAQDDWDGPLAAGTLFLPCACPASQRCECRFYSDGCGACEQCTAALPLGVATRPPCEFATGHDRLRVGDAVYAYPHDLLRVPPLSLLAPCTYRRQLMWGLAVVRYLASQLVRERAVFEAEHARMSNVVMMSYDPRTFYALNVVGSRREEGLFIDVDVVHGGVHQSQRVRLDVAVPRAREMLLQAARAMLQLDAAVAVLAALELRTAGYHIVRVARGMLGRARFRRCLRLRIRELAAILIQKMWRGWYMMYKVFIPMRDYARWVKRMKAAAAIQKVWRSWWLQEPFRRRIEARRVWQRVHLGMRILGYWRGHKLRMQEAGHWPPSKHRAAIAAEAAEDAAIQAALDRESAGNAPPGTAGSSAAFPPPLVSPTSPSGAGAAYPYPSAPSLMGSPVTSPTAPTLGPVPFPVVFPGERRGELYSRGSGISGGPGTAGAGSRAGRTTRGRSALASASSFASSGRVFTVPAAAANRMRARWLASPLITCPEHVHAAFARLEAERAALRPALSPRDRLPLHAAFPDFPISVEALAERLRRDIGHLAETASRQATGHALVRSGRQGTGKWSRSGAVGTQHMRRRFAGLISYFYRPVDPLAQTPSGGGIPRPGERRSDTVLLGVVAADGTKATDVLPGGGSGSGTAAPASAGSAAATATTATGGPRPASASASAPGPGRPGSARSLASGASGATGTTSLASSPAAAGKRPTSGSSLSRGGAAGGERASSAGSSRPGGGGGGGGDAASVASSSFKVVDMRSAQKSSSSSSQRFSLSQYAPVAAVSPAAVVAAAQAEAAARANTFLSHDPKLLLFEAGLGLARGEGAVGRAQSRARSPTAASIRTSVTSLAAMALRGEGVSQALAKRVARAGGAKEPIIDLPRRGRPSSRGSRGSRGSAGSAGSSPVRSGSITGTVTSPAGSGVAAALAARRGSNASAASTAIGSVTSPSNASASGSASATGSGRRRRASLVDMFLQANGADGAAAADGAAPAPGGSDDAASVAGSATGRSVASSASSVAATSSAILAAAGGVGGGSFSRASARLSVAALNATRAAHAAAARRQKGRRNDISDSETEEYEQMRQRALAKRKAEEAMTAPDADSLLATRPLPDEFFHCVDGPIVAAVAATLQPIEDFMTHAELAAAEARKRELTAFTAPLEEAAALVVAAGLVDAAIDTVSAYLQHLAISTRALNADLAKLMALTNKARRSSIVVSEKDKEKQKGKEGADDGGSGTGSVAGATAGDVDRDRDRASWLGGGLPSLPGSHRASPRASPRGSPRGSRSPSPRGSRPGSAHSQRSQRSVASGRAGGRKDSGALVLPPLGSYSNAEAEPSAAVRAEALAPHSRSYSYASEQMAKDRMRSEGGGAHRSRSPRSSGGAASYAAGTAAAPPVAAAALGSGRSSPSAASQH